MFSANTPPPNAVIFSPISINKLINKLISRHSTEARATVRLCRIKEKCLKCVNEWSSSTVQWKRVPKSWSSNRETTSSSVQVVRRKYTIGLDVDYILWLLQLGYLLWLYCPTDEPTSPKYDDVDVVTEEGSESTFS